MFRKSVAAASVLGSAALAVAALSGVSASAAPSTESAPAGLSTVGTAAAATTTTFHIARSANSVKTGCLVKATAKVTVKQAGPVEIMTVTAAHLPKTTDFDFFVTQVPDAPFGLSWYQGDLESDHWGNAKGTFVGRFNEETFTVAPNVAPAPQRHTSPFADAKVNPATAPVHMFHLGLWFNSPKDSAKAGCGNAVTPFNGDHNAGPQAMSTRQFAPVDGPLGRIAS
jgi:hypothetical protein